MQVLLTNPSNLLIADFFLKEREKKKKELTETMQNKKKFIERHNGRYLSYGSKLHIPPTNYHFLAAQQEPYKKSLTLNQKCLRTFFLKKQENRQDRKSKRTVQKNERGDRKGESNDGPEIPDRGWGTSDIPGLLSG